MFVTYSVPDGVLNGGVGTICCGTGSTDPGGRVRFNLFLDILFIFAVVAMSANRPEAYFPATAAE